ncbi:MAG: hypothetical protein EOO77_40605 [Oxalobacteraceae bacterium]|nr:MAG: hypothetical protein EOO77_40605 [Oxalobacteraceae bacterium]
MQMKALASQVAARYLSDNGSVEDAYVVGSGRGDDYVEVRVALRALQDVATRLGRIERALACYADPTFWEADCADASLAFHDAGEVARAALAGKELYALHRD